MKLSMTASRWLLLALLGPLLPIVSGCASAPIMPAAAPRGRSVSVSSVMTKRTVPGGGMAPTIVENAVVAPPRRKALNCSSLPRLRSWPIQRRSTAFHTRGRCNR